MANHPSRVQLKCGYQYWQVVGVIALFFGPAPTIMKQCYLIATGVVTAYMFTFIPEWSTWVLLLAMALYDLCAVLTPHGPLKVRSRHQTSQLRGQAAIWHPSLPAEARVYVSA